MSYRPDFLGCIVVTVVVDIVVIYVVYGVALGVCSFRAASVPGQHDSLLHRPRVSRHGLVVQCGRGGRYRMGQLRAIFPVLTLRALPWQILRPSFRVFRPARWEA